MKKDIHAPKSPLGYLPFCAPILIFPMAFLPYKLWGADLLANIVRYILFGGAMNPFWIPFALNLTAVVFWAAISISVMLAAVLIAALCVRPWYAVLLYLLVMLSLCGIFSLMFFNLTSSGFYG